MACAALRLAKFNVTTSSDDTYFVGIPTTFVALAIALFFLTFIKYVSHESIAYVFPVIMIVCALAMVSTIKLPKLKKRKNVFINIFQIANTAGAYICGFLMLAPEYLFSLVAIYLLVGTGYYFLKHLARSSR